MGGKSLEDLEAAVRQFRLREKRVDLKGLRAVIDSLEREFRFVPPERVIMRRARGPSWAGGWGQAA